MASNENVDAVFKTTNLEACYTFKWIIENYSKITNDVVLHSPKFCPLFNKYWYATFQKEPLRFSTPLMPDYRIDLRFYISSRDNTSLKLTAKILDIYGNLYNKCWVTRIAKSNATVAFTLSFERRDYKDMRFLPNDKCALVCNIVLKNYHIQSDVSNSISQVSSSTNSNKLGRKSVNIYKNGELTDVTLEVQGSSIFAHKVILSARSEVFRNMFQTDMKEKITSVVKINDIEPRIIKLLLEYMYSGVCPLLEFDSAQALFRAADKYSILELKQMTVDFLLSHLTIYNAVELLFFAQSFDEKNLIETVISFVKTHKTESHILESFRKFMDGKYKSEFIELLNIIL